MKLCVGNRQGHAGRRYARGTRTGFTLIELLLVLVILASLAGIVLPKLTGRSQQAKVDEGHRYVRDIMTATSTDFVHWSEPQWLRYPGSPDQELYTNQIAPYYRAPHLLMGFPMRYQDRGWSEAMRCFPTGSTAKRVPGCRRATARPSPTRFSWRAVTV